MNRIALIVVAMTMITLIVFSVPVTHAQNTTTAPATNSTITTPPMPSISQINSTIIINAINAKISLIYDGEKSTGNK